MSDPKNNVFVVMKRIDYEGSTLLEIFKSYTSALKYCGKYIQDTVNRIYPEWVRIEEDLWRNGDTEIEIIEWPLTE